MNRKFKRTAFILNRNFS